MDQIDALARTPELDARLLPLEAGLADLPQVTCLAASLGPMRNGNPAPVIPTADVAFGDEAWASLDGRAVAVGKLIGGELHPSRVFAAPA